MGSSKVVKHHKKRSSSLPRAGIFPPFPVPPILLADKRLESLRKKDLPEGDIDFLKKLKQDDSGSFVFAFYTIIFLYYFLPKDKRFKNLEEMGIIKEELNFLNPIKNNPKAHADVLNAMISLHYFMPNNEEFKSLKEIGVTNLEDANKIFSSQALKYNPDTFTMLLNTLDFLSSFSLLSFKNIILLCKHVEYVPYIFNWRVNFNRNFTGGSKLFSVFNQKTVFIVSEDFYKNENRTLLQQSLSKMEKQCQGFTPKEARELSDKINEFPLSFYKNSIPEQIDAYKKSVEVLLKLDKIDRFQNYIDIEPLEHAKTAIKSLFMKIRDAPSLSQQCIIVVAQLDLLINKLKPNFKLEPEIPKLPLVPPKIQTSVQNS